MIEYTRDDGTLHIVLSSPPELVDQTEILEPLVSSDHNRAYFNIHITVNSEDKQSI